MSATEERALALAYRFINRRERTVSDVRRHLEASDVDASAVPRVLDELREQLVLDDARFARVFAQDKRELEQWGAERIKMSLLQRGIEPELVEQTLSVEPHDSELDRAIELLRRRFPRPPRERLERNRALGVLLRKGYDGELALEAMAVYARGASRS